MSTVGKKAWCTMARVVSFVILNIPITTRSIWYRLIHLTPSDAILMLSVSATAVGVAVQYVDVNTFRTILVAYVAVSNAVLVGINRQRRATDITPVTTQQVTDMVQTHTDTISVKPTPTSNDVTMQ